MSKYTPCSSILRPLIPGFYPVNIVGVRSTFPEYLEFNGTAWVGLEELTRENDGREIQWSSWDLPLLLRPAVVNPFRNTSS